MTSSNAKSNKCSFDEKKEIEENTFTFPDNFSLKYSNAYLNLEEFDLSKARIYIYQSYKNALKYKKKYIIIDCTHFSLEIFNIITREIIDRFDHIIVSIEKIKDDDSFNINSTNGSKLTDSIEYGKYFTFIIFLDTILLENHLIKIINENN